MSRLNKIDSVSVTTDADYHSLKPVTAEELFSRVRLLASKSNVNKSKYALIRSRTTLRDAKSNVNGLNRMKPTKQYFELPKTKKC